MPAWMEAPELSAGDAVAGSGCRQIAAMALAGTDGEAVSREDAATVDDDAGGGWAQ